MTRTRRTAALALATVVASLGLTLGSALAASAATPGPTFHTPVVKTPTFRTPVKTPAKTPAFRAW
jgi:hypothetical protein